MEMLHFIDKCITFATDSYKNLFEIEQIKRIL